MTRSVAHRGRLTPRGDSEQCREVDSPSPSSYQPEGCTVLSANSCQGKFGEDYVRVLASAAGLLVAQDDLDVDGVDLCVKFPGPTARSFSPRIDVQVKTVSRPRRRNGVLVFDGLSAGQFNKLAGDDFVVPRYLFVVQVPTRAEEYVDLSSAGLLLRHLGYFASLRDHPRVDPRGPHGRVPISVPLANVLTVDSLRLLTTGEPTVRGSGVRTAAGR